MRCRIGGEDEDVIEIDNDGNIQKVDEDLVDEGLERCRSVGESKGHHQIFEMAIACAKRCFPLVPFGNADSMVSFTEIKLGKDLSAA